MSWSVRDAKCIPPQREEVLDWHHEFTRAELARLAYGHAPEGEQDWHVFQEGDTVFCHRHGTGDTSAAYRIQLRSGHVFRAWVNADLQEEADKSRQVLEYLLGTLVLSKPVGEPILFCDPSPKRKPFQNRKAISVEKAGIELISEPLQTSNSELIVFGARDTGVMQSGAAGAIRGVAGSEVEEYAKIGLASTHRQLGDVVFTSSGKLDVSGVVGLAHIVSILTKNDDWQPNLEALEEGVLRCLEFAEDLRLRSVTFSAVGSGAGRVDGMECARMMLSAVRRHRQSAPDWPMSITFSLPSSEDFDAFTVVRSSPDSAGR